MKNTRETPCSVTVVEQASYWLMLQWGGELDTEQQRRFVEWRAADPEHDRVWLRLEQLQSTLSGVPSDTALSVLREQPDARRRQTLKLLGMLLLTGGSGYLAQSQLPWREAMADLHSGTGEYLQRTLVDGSQLSLNSASAVDILFNASERRIRLISGELFLNSGHDTAQRPLIVDTVAGEVQALGTRFSVYQDNGKCQVELFDGELELRPRHAHAIRLHAGQGCWFSANQVGDIAPANSNATAWLNGRLIAERTLLGQFVTELARHRSGVLRCDPAVATLPLTGIFPLADTDRILVALEQSLPVKVRRVTPFWVTIGPA